MARSDSGPVASAGIERTTPEGSGLAEPVDDVGAVSGPISLVHPHSSHRSLKLSLGLMVAVLVALGLGGAVAYLVFAMK